MNYKLIMALLGLGAATAVGLQSTEARTPALGDTVCDMRWIVMTSPDGQNMLRIKAEEALDNATRRKGLMFRKEMPFDEGMIFYWAEPQPIYMWMKNTFIPLDMVFANDGKVTGVVEASETQSERVLTVEGNTDTVLEVNLGIATSKGVTAGWTVKPAGCVENTQ